MDTRVELFTIFAFFIVLGPATVQCQDTFYFNLKPQDQDVVESTEISLLCDVSNRKHISFQWIQDGKPVTNSSRRFQEGSNLRILRITRDEDSGPFQCIATNITTGFSLQSGEALLNVQWLEPTAAVELKKPKPDEVALGADIQLRCAITGNPEPVFYWYQNQFRIFNKDNVKVVDHGTRLKITGAQARDNGVYSCRAENVARGVDSSSNFLLNILAPDTPHLIEQDFTPYKLALKNSPARLDCPFVNATRIDWFANYEKLSNSSRHTIFDNGSLYFPRVRASDEAGYRCEGLSNHRDRPAQTFTAELVIASLGDFGHSSFEPRLISDFPMVVPVHQQFVVKAFPPSGKPTPTAKWLDRNDLQIGTSGPIHLEGTNLVFDDPQEIDSGNYTFIINNTAGEKPQNVWIIVSVPPIIRRGPIPQNIEEGHPVKFNCVVTGTNYPVTMVIWQKDDELIKLGSPHHQMNKMTGELRITDVTAEDEGEYACVANTTGQELVVSSRAFLRVIKKLKFNPPPQDTFLELDSDAEVKCHADAETQPRINWLRGDWKQAGLNFNSHITDSEGVLYFRGVQRSDAGLYTCVARLNGGPTPAIINKTIFIDVVEKPKFQYRPTNTTAYEEHSVMIHCVATGDPKPTITWDKYLLTDNWDKSRFKFFPNGTMVISKVYMEDQGLYGCSANNSAGRIHTVAHLYVASGSEYEQMNPHGEEEGFDMMRTVIIAVCSAGAYLALVIGLTAFCSYRLLLQRRNRNAMAKKQNGNLSQEQHELLMKDRDRDSGGTQCRSDSDNRSHASGLSSQPSHSSSSHAQSHSQPPSQSSRGRKDSIDHRLFFPRHELQTLGMLGKGQYGDVFLAKARGIRPGELESQVVVKSLLTKDERLFFEFRKEVDMYTHLDHTNIIKILGVCRENEPHFVITEHCDWGDLKQFLLASRTDNNGRRMQRIPPLTILQKLGMCNQVALGMEHLANRRYVHKDLAARNVLLTSRLELKISSLALSRDVYASEYITNNMVAIPLRWMAPESVLEGELTTLSDVWAFGVFVWEVFHLADLPHKNRTDEELLKGLKVGDVTLEISEQCPNEIRDMIRSCTRECAKDRPQFTEICNMFGELLSMFAQPAQFTNSAPQSVASYPSNVSYAMTQFPMQS